MIVMVTVFTRLLCVIQGRMEVNALPLRKKKKKEKGTRRCSHGSELKTNETDTLLRL